MRRQENFLMADDFVRSLRKRFRFESKRDRVAFDAKTEPSPPPPPPPLPPPVQAVDTFELTWNLIDAALSQVEDIVKMLRIACFVWEV
jgi:hypothetical protein